MDLDGSVKYVRNKKMRAVKVHDNQIEYDIKLLILTLCSLSIIISFIGSSRATARFLK